MTLNVTLTARWITKSVVRNHFFAKESAVYVALGNNSYQWLLCVAKESQNNAIAAS